MKIAVYSGSFNPLHIGHLSIMEYLTREADFDWVYLVVSPKNPIKTTISADSAEERYEAAIQAVKRHPDLHVWVDDIELRMDPPQYTIRTLDALKRREPENDFTLVIGGDNLEGIHRWRDFQRILTDYGVVVFPREGTNLAETRELLMKECACTPSPFSNDTEGLWEGEESNPEHRISDGMRGFENLEDHIYRIRIVDAPLVNVSSTMIREGLERGEDMSRYLM